MYASAGAGAAAVPIIQAAVSVVASIPSHDDSSWSGGRKIPFTTIPLRPKPEKNYRIIVTSSIVIFRNSSTLSIRKYSSIEWESKY
jgi:hypothetical protein